MVVFTGRQGNGNFNPRSREGSDQTGSPPGSCLTISIRAPARGATIIRRQEGWQRSYFNPRSREGSDDQGYKGRGRRRISIRAPARGATPVQIISGSSWQFQSALPRGERRCFRSITTRPREFQSALPRGERRTSPFSPQNM